MLHPFLDREVSLVDFRNAGKSETEVNAWSNFLSGKLYTEFRAGEMNLAFKGFTNLGWANYFRHEFITIPNIDDIRGSGFPCFVDENGITITLTDRIGDLTYNFDLFNQRRSQLKALLGIDKFLFK